MPIACNSPLVFASYVSPCKTRRRIAKEWSMSSWILLYDSWLLWSSVIER